MPKLVITPCCFAYHTLHSLPGQLRPICRTRLTACVMGGVQGGALSCGTSLLFNHSSCSAGLAQASH